MRRDEGCEVFDKVVEEMRDKGCTHQQQVRVLIPVAQLLVSMGWNNPEDSDYFYDDKLEEVWRNIVEEE